MATPKLPPVVQQTKLKSNQMANLPTNNIPKAWLGGLLRQITPPAIKLISEQHRYAVASRLDGNTLDHCEMPCQFQQQYGLPCAHTILDLLDHDQALTRDLVHTRWWLQSQ
ncbi:hypothetical protein E4U19_006980, partial [Claviceps sp. Clav32 group G5]